jgi:phosphoglycolate phosphatase
LLNAILVDLDGTIIDPAPGIIACYSYALEQLGIAPPAPDQIRALIGPPLRRGFARFLAPHHDVEDAVRLYRELYGAKGMLDATLYPGIGDALQVLRARYQRLYVCTAKATKFAQPILEHFGLAHLFDGIYGADLEGRFDDKADLIAHMLTDATIDPKINPKSAVMVGDRANDVLAAARNGIVSVGALWGYGSAEELQDAGAAMLCALPEELAPAIANLSDQRSQQQRATPAFASPRPPC